MIKYNALSTAWNPGLGWRYTIIRWMKAAIKREATADEQTLSMFARTKGSKNSSCDGGAKPETRLNYPKREQARRSQMLIVIRGAIKAILVDDDKNIIDAKVIRPADGVYGVQLPKNVWYFDKLSIDSLSNVWNLTLVCSR